MFFAVELAAVFVLVPVFGILLLKFYETGVTSFSPVYPLLMLIFSGLTVALKWKEEINWFVLIFVVLTTVFYLSFGLWLKSRKDNKAKAVCLNCGYPQQNNSIYCPKCGWMYEGGGQILGFNVTGNINQTVYGPPIAENTTESAGNSEQPGTEQDSYL